MLIVTESSFSETSIVVVVVGIVVVVEVVVFGYWLKSKDIAFVEKISNFLDKFLKIYILTISVTGPFELRDALRDYFSEAILIVLVAIFVVYVVVESTSKLFKIERRDAVFNFFLNYFIGLNNEYGTTTTNVVK